MTVTNMCSNFGGFRCRPPLNAATGIEVTHLDIYALFKKEWASFLSDSSKITDPAGLDPPQKMYQRSVFLIQRKCPASLLMSYLYMETVQFKPSLECLEEIYQLNHRKELDLRRQALPLLTSEWKMYR